LLFHTLFSREFTSAPREPGMRNNCVKTAAEFFRGFQ
jgi:hypothetical protein